METLRDGGRSAGHLAVEEKAEYMPRHYGAHACAHYRASPVRFTFAAGPLVAFAFSAVGVACWRLMPGLILVLPQAGMLPGTSGVPP